jgi:hypothetical protein
MMNNEEIRVWKKVVAYFKVLLQNSCGETEGHN